jgi:hypothetical protein
VPRNFAETHCRARPTRYASRMATSIRLQQGQVWKQGERYLRIVQLERLEVDYKAITDLVTKEGKHHRVSKKEFCRLIKGATLVGAEERE